MPTYEYACDACGHKFEEFQSITSKPIKKCPVCKKNKVKRLISAGAGFIFKGSGFYITDYRSDNYKAGEKSANGSEAAKTTDAAKSGDTAKSTEASKTDAKGQPATAAKAETKSESKPAAKSESTSSPKTESKPAGKKK